MIDKLATSSMLFKLIKCEWVLLNQQSWGPEVMENYWWFWSAICVILHFLQIIKVWAVSSTIEIYMQNKSASLMTYYKILKSLYSRIINFTLREGKFLMSQWCYQVALPPESAISKYLARFHLVSFYIIRERLVRKWWWGKSTTPAFPPFFLAHLFGKHLYYSLLLLITSKYTQQRY